jgi:glycosyltransferase involved in cell wall biosynthesis
MKVLHLSAGNLYGGIETFLTTLARMRHLAPGMEPEFGLCFRGRQWDELAASGAAVHDLGPVRLSRPWTARRARGRLRRLLTDARPEVVVIHSPWAHTTFAPVVQRAGVQLVHLAHNGMSGRGWIERWAARTPPDLVLANSRFTAGSVGNVFPGIPVEVWHYPVARPEVDDLARSEIRSDFGTPEGTVVILQASRLERWKGQVAHLEALTLLRDVPGWECWLAGGVQRECEAEFMAELQSTAERAGIADRVRFLGQRSDVTRLMAAADVFCQPNTGPEPFGIVFVESLYSGLPVVTSGFGGAAEIVDGTCGILCPPGDASAVAAALRGLISDPALRRTLGAAGPSRAESLCSPGRQLGVAATLLRAGRDSQVDSTIPVTGY